MQITENIKYSKSSYKFTRERQHNGEKNGKRYNQTILIRSNPKRQQTYEKKIQTLYWPENEN